MKFPEVEERRIPSFDGTEIAYHVVGRGPTILLCNGLGGSWKAWAHQIAYLGDRYRFISWDYRGLYRSRSPKDRNALRVVDHALDGLAVLDAERVDRAALFGWSMGVQVALEMFRTAPERAAAFVLMNGVPGRIWSSALGSPALGHVVPSVLRGLQRVPWLANAVTRRAVHIPQAIQVVKSIGLASRTLDEEVFHALAASFEELDMATYTRVLELLGEHEAIDVLPDVDVPTLVIAGERDLFTPATVVSRMARNIPGAELLVVPGGTHYVAVEYPEVVNLRIEKFFRERGFGASRVP